MTLIARQPLSRTLAIGSILIALQGICACSLLTSWDPDGLRCTDDAEQACRPGFSCLHQSCVRDHSVPKGGSCLRDSQCQEPYGCVPSLYDCSNCDADGYRFSCQTKCNGNIYTTLGCSEPGDYCKPYAVIDAEGRTSEVVGYCAAGDSCNDDAVECPSGKSCVNVGSDVFACLRTCTVDVSSGYSDDCGGSSHEYEYYCQPVGPSDQQSTVCLINGGSRTAGSLVAQSEGSVCQPLEQPCERGLACIGARCLAYCPPETGGTGSDPCKTSATPNARCCEQTLGGGSTSYGLCVADGNCG